MIIGVDPGFRESAYVHFNGTEIWEHGIVSNEILLSRLEDWKIKWGPSRNVLVVEQISMGGMIAGAEIFETCFISGRFVEMWSPRRWDRIKRKDIKLHLCGQVRAKDGNVRQALIDRFGPDKETAVGKKSKQGPLFGIHAHEWAALAVAVTYWDQHHQDGEFIRPNVQAEF